MSVQDVRLQSKALLMPYLVNINQTSSVLSQGISEALYTTAIGLGIAIPSLVMHNYLREQAENLILDIEKKSIQVVNHLFETSGSRSSPAAPFSGGEKVGEL